MFIPIGVDCGNAGFLKENNLRSSAFPFDWIVTYDGVSKIIKDNFKGFVPNNNNNLFNSNYNTLYINSHNYFPNDIEKIVRRINRFKEILENSKEEIIFIRKGHAPHHHQEQSARSCCIVKNDIKDAEELDIILKEKYPELNYKIIIILICGSCFDTNKTYKPTSNNIKIHNIATSKVDDEKYKNLCKKILIDKE